MATGASVAWAAASLGSYGPSASATPGIELSETTSSTRQERRTCLGVAPRFLDPTTVYVVRTGASIRAVAASRTDAPILSRAPPNSRFAWKAEAGAALLRCPQGACRPLLRSWSADPEGEFALRVLV